MKRLSIIAAAIAFLACATYGCNKSNYSSGPDRTHGMVSLRSWSGTDSGYGRKDTIDGGIHMNTAAHYNRVIADTSFAIQKVNDFAISVFGNLFQYKGTDSLTTHTVKYDSLFAGAAATSRVTYYYSKDSITFELHQVYEWDTIKHRNYTTDLFLHTNHS